MPDVQLSICISSNRPHLWEWFYHQVAMNTINFEIQFVGPVKPSFTLPDNCHYTYTNTKPLQCMHIAILRSNAEVLQWNVDDCQNSPYSLDILYNLYKTQNDYKCMVSPKFFGVLETPKSIEELQKIADTTPMEPDYLFVPAGQHRVPVIPSGGLISKQLYLSLGGFDRRFIWAGADMDFFLRAYFAGAKMIYCKDAWSVERKDLCPGWINGKSKSYEYNRWDTISPMWYRDRNIPPQDFLGVRTSPLEPFVDDGTLLTVSQGPKGEWD